MERLLGRSPLPTLSGWTDEQRRVIEAQPHARMIVQGGPGTGKTAVACARIAHLIDRQELAPEHIWIISFTRVAVREIRERIGSSVKDATLVQELTITTLDSLAARLTPDQNDPSDESSSFDDAIGAFTKALPFETAIHLQLGGLRHLLIDESHDVVGPRATLLETMIRYLPHECGITVCADDAQCIYGFADSSRIPKPALPQRLDFPVETLTHIHRARSSALARLFRLGRALTLDASLADGVRHKRLIRVMKQAAAKQPRPTDDKTLILYRRRADALAASADMLEMGAPHRLRTSGHPTIIAPWIAMTLSGIAQPTLSHGRFSDLWTKKSKNAGIKTTGMAIDDAWERLYAAAPLKGEIHMAALRERLMEASPPIDLCLPEIGGAGPTISTIHASKGREAEHVILTMPHSTGRRDQTGEETRIVYVGATRAKSTLHLQTIESLAAQTLTSGRMFHRHPRSPFSIALELGLDGDLTPMGLAGRGLFSSSHVVTANQAALQIWAGQIWAGHSPLKITAEAMSAPLMENNGMGNGGHYALSPPNHPEPWAYLSPQVITDLEDIRHLCFEGRAAFPKRLANLFMVGVRTMVFDVHDERSADVYFPWSESGFILAPIILGMGAEDFSPIPLPSP